MLFIILSLRRSEKSYYNFLNTLFLDTSFGKKKIFEGNYLTKKLDYLLPNFSFFEKEVLVYKEKKPLLYLYNTHDTEKYKDDKSVLDATNALFNNLKKLGLDAIKEEKRVSDFLIDGISPYDISRNFISDISKDNNITYFVDIHRDSVNDTMVTINNKNYAKILFVLGCDNKNYQENKKVLEKMHQYLENNYKGISKGILEKSGKGVNGIYNQDLGKNILLIEIGGVDNNIEEVNNSTEILALMFYDILGDKR